MNAMERTLTVIRQRENLEIPTLSVQLILQTGGMGMYSNMCCDRISDEGLIDGEEVQINFANIPDIILTADGIMRCKDILESYVQDNILTDAFSLLCEVEQMDKEIHNMAKILRDAKIKELLKLYKVIDKASDENGAKRIKKYISAEIWNRSILAVMKRKISKFIRNIYLNVKYRGLFQYMKQAAAGFSESAT